MLPVKVQECLCWVSSKDYEEEPVPDVRIPFAARVDIGVKARVSAHLGEMMGTGKRNVAATWQDSFAVLHYGTKSLARKSKRKAAVGAPGGMSPPVRIKFREVDAFGAFRTSTFAEVERYEAVCIRNFPSVHDTTPTNFAISEVQSLQLLPSASASAFLGQLFERDGKFSGQKSEINLRDKIDECVERLATSVRTVFVDITCVEPQQRMHVLVDGVLYGPFSRVITQPFRFRSSSGAAPSNEGMDLNIGTFVPMST